MNALSGALAEIQAEVQRCSQRLDGRDVLPDRIHVVMPIRVFGEWAPVLPQVVGELGDALVEWAGRRGNHWYGGNGPALDVVLEDLPSLSIEAEFSGDTSRDTVMVRSQKHQDKQG